MFYIGCHLSAADGFLAMGKSALSIKANVFQFFTRNPRGGSAKPIKQADVDVLIANLNTTIQNLNTLTENLDTILANQQSSLGKVLYDKELYNQLDSTLANASRLLEDLRNHPKRYVHFSLFGRKNK